MEAILFALVVLIAYIVGVVIFHFRREIMNLILGLVSWWIGRQWWPKIRQFIDGVYHDVYRWVWSAIHMVTCPACWEWRLNRWTKFFVRLWVKVTDALVDVYWCLVLLKEDTWQCASVFIANALGAVLYGVKNMVHLINGFLHRAEEWLWDVMGRCEEIDERMRR